MAIVTHGGVRDQGSLLARRDHGAGFRGSVGFDGIMALPDGEGSTPGEDHH